MDEGDEQTEAYLVLVGEGESEVRENVVRCFGFGRFVDSTPDPPTLTSINSTRFDSSPIASWRRKYDTASAVDQMSKARYINIYIGKRWVSRG